MIESERRKWKYKKRGTFADVIKTMHIVFTYFTVWKLWNFIIALCDSHIFGKNFVKITCFTKEVTKYKLKRCFDEIFFSVSKFFCFRHCVFVFDSFWFSKNDFQLCLLLSYCFDDPIKTISYPIFLRDFLLLRKFFFLPGLYPLIFPPLCVTFCVC